MPISVGNPTVSILDIPEGPIKPDTSDGTKVDNVEINSLADYTKNYASAEKYATSDVSRAPEIPEDFGVLSKAHAIYLQELSVGENLEFLTGKYNYEIKSQTGLRIFVATDNSDEYKQSICSGGTHHHEPFSFTLFDFFGRQILTIDGHLGGCGSGAAVKISTLNHGIGSILQGDFNSPHYVVVNWEGKEIFSIHHGERHSSFWQNLKLEASDPKEFGIYRASQMEKKLVLVGSFFPILSTSQDEETHEKKITDTMRLTYPTQCDLSSKLLLMGALFVVDYRLIKRKGRNFELRGHHTSHRFLTIPCFGLTIGIMIGLIILAVLIYELTIHIINK